MTKNALSAIGEKFYATLVSGKYTNWAAELDEPTLMAVLWYMGEVLVRSSGKDDYSAETFPKRCEHCDGNYPAARVDSALEGLVKISRGKRFREDEDFFEWIRQGVLERSGVEL